MSDFSLEYATPERTDSARAEFLKELDDSSSVEVNDWEAQFLEDNLGRTKFTPAQRREIDKMITKYDEQL